MIPIMDIKDANQAKDMPLINIHVQIGHLLQLAHLC